MKVWSHKNTQKTTKGVLHCKTLIARVREIPILDYI